MYLFRQYRVPQFHRKLWIIPPRLTWRHFGPHTGVDVVVAEENLQAHEHLPHERVAHKDNLSVSQNAACFFAGKFFQLAISPGAYPFGNLSVYILPKIVTFRARAELFGNILARALKTTWRRLKRVAYCTEKVQTFAERHIPAEVVLSLQRIW